MAAPIDILLPDEQVTDEALVVGWLKQVGDRVEEHEPIVEVSTDKVTMEVAAPASGVLTDILVPADGQAGPGTVLGRIDPQVTANGDAPAHEAAPDMAARSHADASAPGSSTADSVEPDRRQRLSPLVKRMLAEHELAPEQIEGTGRGGRIRHQDVQAFIEEQEHARAAEPPPQRLRPSASPGAAPTGGSRMVPHTPMRRRIADHMVESLLRTAPHVTALFDCDLTRVIAHRAEHKAAFAEKGVRLTYTAYFVAAAVEALQAVPEINSRWHDDALEVFDDANIGIATALGSKGLGSKGLIVPVLRQAQHLGLLGIATQLQDLTERARDGRLQAEDTRGGTFTITNHGVSGSLLATPIINQPQSAILGLGKIEKRVKVVEVDGRDTIQVLPMCYVSLTIDHRALDGFQANAFLSRFVEVLEGWS